MELGNQKQKKVEANKKNIKRLNTFKATKDELVGQNNAMNNLIDEMNLKQHQSMSFSNSKRRKLETPNNQKYIFDIQQKQSSQYAQSNNLFNVEKYNHELLQNDKVIDAI